MNKFEFMESYDLIVIGSGVGLTVVNTGLQLGLKCALIEDTKIGGTCLTRGCIPSKILVHPADLIRESQHAAKVGIHFNIEKIDWDLIAKRMWSQIEESKSMENGLSTVPNLALYRGVGEFTGEYEIIVKSNDGKKELGNLKGEKIVIASGARSLIPPIEGIEDVGYVTNENFFGEKFPKKPWNSLAIIGGGVIAAEFAHVFSALGTEVTIIEMLPHLVATEEPEISEFLEKNFKKHMTVLVNHKAIGVKGKRKQKLIIVENVNTGKTMEVKAEEIMIATGRKSNADILSVQKTGIETDDKGWIKTNEYLETSKENVWCIGDANGLYQFRHKANYEAEICTNNIFGEQKISADYSSVPWAIFTYPQVGHVGMTEAEAIEKDHKIFVGMKNYSTVAKGFAMGYEENDDDDGFVKLIVDKSYKILGAHVVGPNAAILVQPFVYLMNAGYTCIIPEKSEEEAIPKIERACPEAGSFMPIYQSMVIHPSLNEVTGWAIGSLRPVNIEMHHHDHDHS
ncbi:MAG: dihydrolipoyl dehydrogenase [Promethearchaeota archaeon]|nr:MAG: dihydrolipoyl dehydrogenase [Candidatus Lokiarchaeota archaeon]